MAAWNCNGSYRLDVGAFEDSFKDRDIVFYSETHQVPGQSMPRVTGYLWETAGRPDTRSLRGSRGSGGVAVLFKEELKPLLQIVRKDEQARYMWVRLKAETGRFLYIAICYFPPSTSVYSSPKGQSPFSILDNDIWEFSRDGDIILLGDFNARTANSQTVFYDTSEEMLREVDVSQMGLVRQSQDKEQTEYGTYLREMTTIHGLAILNGLEAFPSSGGFTCFPHRHGASTVDYIITSPSFMSSIQDFKVGPRPVGVAVDHALLTFSVSFQYSASQTQRRVTHTRYTFTPETDSVYVEEIYKRMWAAEPVYTVEEITSLLTEILHGAAKEAYPHTQPDQKRGFGNMPQNSWYDEECRETRAQIQRELTLGIITYRQSRIALRRLVRRKKRTFLAQLEHDLYQLFLSKDSSEAWRFFHEHSPPPVITSPEIWGQYATSLYDVPGQPPLPDPIESCPATSTFFTKEMVKKAIDRMKTRRAYDHDGLVAEHLIHARDLLSEVLARLFNRVMYEGLPDSWRLSTIVPIFKSGDPMIPGNYRTIMVGHTLTRLYASILEQRLNGWAEDEGVRATGQAGFRRGFSTLDHILTLRAIIEEGRANGKRMYCCFVDFRKAFDTVPRARLMRRMQDLGVPKEIIWGIMALYGSVIGHVRTPEGISDTVHSTIGVKQGCPLSPTLFGMYIDEVSDYIDREGDRGAQLAGTWIPLLLYADDIVLIAESPEGMQKQLDAVHKFAEDSGLSVNLGKTKVMVFNTTPQWVRRSAPKFAYGQDIVEYTDTYTYLGVVFAGPKFTLKKAADARLSRAYAALGGLERMCSQIQFQEPRTKLWLFDTLVTSAMLYGVQIWGPSVDQDSWRSMERPLISMISRMIRAKASVPHAIIRAELAAPPIEIEALTRSVSFIHSLWNTNRCRYTRLALESSRQLAMKGDTSCWYAQMTSWFQRHGFSMDRLPPFQYSLDAPSLPITRTETNKIIRQDLIQLDTKKTWVEPTQELGTKMAFYRENFLQLSEDGFVTRPSYMDTHLSHGLRCAIGQIRTSSHQLEIEFGRFRGIPPESRICKLCGIEPETELHYICHCTVYYEIRGRFHCLFREGFGPLDRVMQYQDQRCLGLYLLELNRHRDNLMRRQRARQSQRQITDFFGSRETREEGEARSQQPTQRATHTHTQGTLIDRATELGKSRRPRPRCRSTLHRRRLQQRIRSILARHTECS